MTYLLNYNNNDDGDVDNDDDDEVDNDVNDDDDVENDVNDILTKKKKKEKNKS